MTVNIEHPYSELAWTGAQSSFATGIQAQDKAHIAVSYLQDGTDVSVDLVDGVHLTLARNPTTEVITGTPIAMPPPSGVVRFTRTTPAIQGTDFANLVAFTPAVHTKLHDASALRDQELGHTIGAMMPDLEAILAAIEAALALLEQSVPINVPDFETRLAASLATIGQTVKSVRCRGRSFAGDKGGGEWKRVASDPGHALINFRSVDRFLPNGATDAVNGGYWEFVPIEPLRMQHAGGIASASDADAAANTAALQAVFDMIAGGKAGFFWAGDQGEEFRLDSLVATLVGATGFRIEGYGTFKKRNGAVTTDGAGNGIWTINQCSRFEVGGRITLDGNRANRVPNETFINHTFQMYGPSKFKVSGINVINGVFDGMLLGAMNPADPNTFSRDGVIEDCYAFNNFRNGLSVIDFQNIEIRGGDYSNSNGTNPQAGVDVEPDAGAALSGNIKIRGVSANANVGRGILLSNVSGADNSTVSECRITNCADGGIGSFMSTVDIINNHIDTCGLHGILVTGDAAAAAAIGVIGNRVINSAIGILISLPDCFVVHNHVRGSTGFGIHVETTAPRTVVAHNNINGAVGRGIKLDCDIGVVDRNFVRDVSAPVAYIECLGSFASATYNFCEASASTPTGIGIRMTSAAAACVNNTCINLHATDPYPFTGGFAGVLFGCNVGGSANSRLVMRNPASPAL
jgi:hypothetical protein